jgi:hypothetical protein
VFCGGIRNGSGVNILEFILNKSASLFRKVNNPGSISEYITGLFIKHFHIPLIAFIIAVAIGGFLLGWKNPLLLVLYIPVLAAFFVSFLPPKRKVGERIWEVACPECGNYISLHEWRCLCKTDYRERHILQGCSIDGTRYGSGEDSEIKSVECATCRHELDLYEPYPFKKWSVLGKGEVSDEEFIQITRETWLYAIGTAFTLGGGLTALFLILKNIPSSNSSGIGLTVMIIVAGLIVLGELFLLLEPRVFYPRRFIRNPKYKGDSD